MTEIRRAAGARYTARYAAWASTVCRGGYPEREERRLEQYLEDTRMYAARWKVGL